MKKKIRIFSILLAAAMLFQNYSPAEAAEKEMNSEQTTSDVSGNEGNVPEDSDSGSTINNKKDDDHVVITGFSELKDSKKLTFDEKIGLKEVLKEMPETLTVQTGQNEISLPVSWKCTDDYESSELEIYQFVPFWDEEKYSISEDLNLERDVPCIEVSVPLPEKKQKQDHLEAAEKELNNILQDNNVSALVYLCDKYKIRENADSESKTVISVPSGFTVQISGFKIDRNQAVWYAVSTAVEDATYTGFIEKDYLAYSSEVFLKWEKEYLSDYIKTRRARSVSYADVEQFPESYQDKLMQLKKNHPNWIFVKQNTGLNWKNVVDNENYQDRNLISSSQGAAYKNGYYGSGWYYASEAAVKYYLDPRNFLSDTQIFQFEQLTYNPSYHTQSAVQNVLNSTFMSGGLPGADKTYAQAFFEIGVAKGVSPFHLACRVYQEQGSGTSGLISGVYPGYEGYYNYYNIGASGSTTAAIITSGLSKAKTEGWSTRYKSLNGGAAVLSGSYILKGQDTLYLQKFDVDASYNGLYWHQYMQNIMAPYTECQMVRKAYVNTGSLDNTFVFKIPVYNNMPSAACPIPGSEPTASPTPTMKPTASPVPTVKPTEVPTASPAPTVKPTTAPTETPDPTGKPTFKPTESPTEQPDKTPSSTPKATSSPADRPTVTPTSTPKATSSPTDRPTVTPTSTPKATSSPTDRPTITPTSTPKATAAPTSAPAATPVSAAQSPASATPDTAVSPAPTVKAAATPEVASQIPGESGTDESKGGQGTASNGVTIGAVDKSKATPSPFHDAKTVVMDISKTGMMYQETIDRIREQGITAELTISDTISWKVDGSNLPDEEIGDIDMEVTLGRNVIPDDKIKELAGNHKYVELSLAHDGSFGFKAVLNIKLEEAVQGQYANLFYYNPETEEFEYVCASTVGIEKDTAFEFAHASDYLIVLSDTDMEKLFDIKKDAKRPSMITDEITSDKQAAPNLEEPAEEPVKAGIIIIMIVLVSTAIALGAYLIYKRKDD